jgi:hypothetical protein
MPLTFRPYTGPKDLDHQYRIWTAATEGLPFAWRSTETNVRYISSHAPKFPGSRLFAERDGPGGEVVGYIGTHDPFQWKTLGMAVPFGFPWTWPRDGALERELYDRMFASTPSVYAGQKIDFYIQRFRRSWTHHHAFLSERGWREAWADPILTRPVGKTTGTPKFEKLTDAHVDEVVKLAAADPTALKPAPDANGIRARFTDGWCEWDSAWIIPGAGAVAIEVRKPGGYAEIKTFYATPAGFADVVALADAQAAAMGARELYFTIRPGGEARKGPVEKLGFKHVDDDVFVRRDLAALKS